jgi:hypothetical protein
MAHFRFAMATILSAAIGNNAFDRVGASAIDAEHQRRGPRRKRHKNNRAKASRRQLPGGMAFGLNNSSVCGLV